MAGRRRGCGENVQLWFSPSGSMSCRRQGLSGAYDTRRCWLSSSAARLAARAAGGRRRRHADPSRRWRAGFEPGVGGGEGFRHRGPRDAVWCGRRPGRLHARRYPPLESCGGQDLTELRDGQRCPLALSCLLITRVPVLLSPTAWTWLSSYTIMPGQRAEHGGALRLMRGLPRRFWLPMRVFPGAMTDGRVRQRCHTVRPAPRPKRDLAVCRAEPEWPVVRTSGGIACDGWAMVERW